jgi:putative redox protein
MARLTAFLETGTRVTINTEHHNWYADEPVAAGGTDEGPTPYEMLLGGLAACTTLTLRLYADHKGIALAWIKAEYEFDRVHIRDCDECETDDGGMIERVRAHVTLGGTFTLVERERLEQIVGRCPVHKTLTHGMRIFDHVAFVDTESHPLDRIL